eukprot:4687357-Pyramimonas_sp.AAC.1
MCIRDRIKSFEHHRAMGRVHHITSLTVHSIFAPPPESSWDPRRYSSEGGPGLWKPLRALSAPEGI